MHAPRSGSDAAAEQTIGRHLVQVIRLSTPIAIAQIAQILMAMTDTILLGRLGSNALAAGGLAANLYFTITIFLAGFLASIAALVSQARGAGRDGDVPAVFGSGLLLVAILALPLFVMLSYAEELLLLLGEPPQLAAGVGSWLGQMRFAAPFSLMSAGLMKSFLPAIERPRLVTWVMVGAVGLNALLNYGLIFGAWGLPRMEVRGSGLATALTTVATSGIIFGVVWFGPSYRRWVRPFSFNRRTMLETMRLGWPIAITYGAELGLFLVSGLLMGYLGTPFVAAHQMVLNFASATFMVPFAIGQAANVRVGYFVGAGELRQARRAGFTAIALGAGFMCCTALLMLLAPRTILGLYLDLDLTANAPAVAIAVGLLAIAGLFQVADGIQAIAAGALRGLKDTRTPMLLAIAGYWGIGAPTAWILCFQMQLAGVGIWAGLGFGLGTVALALAMRFHLRTRGRHALTEALAPAV